MKFGWEVPTNETGGQTAELLERSICTEKCRKQSVVLHLDNGAAMKSLTMQAKCMISASSAHVVGHK